MTTIVLNSKEVYFYTSDDSHRDDITVAKFPFANTIQAEAFNKWDDLTSVHCPLVTKIHCGACYLRSKLKYAYFPKATSIGAHAFIGCRSLTHGYFPLAKSIKTDAFRGCKNLRYIVLPYVGALYKLYVKLGLFLSQNTVMIAAKDFDHSLLSENSSLIAKLYSQGPHIAKALLSLAKPNVTTIDDLRSILDNRWSFPIRLFLKIARNLLHLFDKFISLFTSNNSTYHKQIEAIHHIKSDLMNKTGITNEELSKLKSHYTRKTIHKLACINKEFSINQPSTPADEDASRPVRAADWPAKADKPINPYSNNPAGHQAEAAFKIAFQHLCI